MRAAVPDREERVPDADNPDAMPFDVDDAASFPAELVRRADRMLHACLLTRNRRSASSVPEFAL
jgi:hypothetical protein